MTVFFVTYSSIIYSDCINQQVPNVLSRNMLPLKTSKPSYFFIFSRCHVIYNLQFVQ